MIKIKVCGMKYPSNVKDISETGPDYLGFIFYPGSPRYVGIKPDKALFHNVPSAIKKIGVFLNEDKDRILDISIHAGLDIVQLHGNESPVTCFQLKSSGQKIIKTFNIGEGFSFEDLMPYMLGCDYFLFDTKTEKPGGSGKKFSWEKLDEYTLDKPFFLSGGIGPEDIKDIRAIKLTGLFAVDVNSRFEDSPGIKNVKLVREFINEFKEGQI